LTKQEEIRKGIETIISDQGYYFPWGKTAQEILAYLHSQGVVIKVEKELPSDKNLYGVAKDNMAAGCYYHGQIDMKEAGYVAVEPIIKEK